MPAKVLRKMRPTVAAGVSNDVEDVNHYAAPMYAPTAGAARTPPLEWSEGEDQQDQPGGRNRFAQQVPRGRPPSCGALSAPLCAERALREFEDRRSNEDRPRAAIESHRA